MAMEDFIEPLKFSVVVDTAEYENKMKQAKLLARDSKKEISQDTKLKLEVDIAQLQFQLQKAKEMMKNATNDSTKFSLQLQTNELQRNLTEAKRSLNNFLNT
jgi:predicted  nucleic acid-binding Zn-ribbon protein